MQTLTRRRWMSGLALAAAAGRGGRAAPSGPTVIDAHAHVWSPDLHKYPLAPGLTRENLWFPSFTVEELVQRGSRAGVTRYNLIQMTCYGLDHSYILDVIADDPTRFVGTGIVPAVSDVSLPSPDRTMKALARGGIYAFRIRGRSTRPALGNGERWMDHPGFDQMFAAGARHDLCLSFLMTPADLPELDRMCRRFPETPVIIDHFCLIGKQADRVEEETRALCRMARHPRVMLKLGAFYALGKKQPPYLDMLPLIRRLVDAFDPHRCMWESDAPLQTRNGHTIEAAVAVIRDHADFLSSSDKQQILAGTAERLFFRRSPSAGIIQSASSSGRRPGALE